jgi:hypothetical protein
MASRIDLISGLCYEPEEGQAAPAYALDYLYWLEGLGYVELVKITRGIEKGAPLPQPSTDDLADMPATIRRRIAEALGVPPGRSGAVSASCQKGLNLIARELKKEGVSPPKGRRAELLAVASALAAGAPIRASADVAACVRQAVALIAEVDKHVTK